MKPYTIEELAAIREAADAISRIASTGIGMQIQGADEDNEVLIGQAEELQREFSRMNLVILGDMS